MDIKKRMLLQHHMQDIVKDLDVNHILDELFTKNVISNEDFDHIYNLPDRVERARFLIGIILTSNNNAYEAFVGSLQKDYKWLYEKLSVENNQAMIEDSFEDCLSRGDVPRLPDHFISRASLERELHSKLKILSRHKILVLYGMPGCGKTVLAISVLRKESTLIMNDFNGVVFWLNLSNCKTEDDVIAQQNRLYRKASLMFNQNSFMNSSMSLSSACSRGDSLSNYDHTSEELKHNLKLQFSGEPLKEALLVLDEVNEKNILEAFDIGCKILVTTRDREVFVNFDSQIVEVENHFSETESLELFASCLGVEAAKLPRQAKKLHEVCKGSPFHIALIVAELAENKERLINDPQRWNYYIDKLRKKELFSLPRREKPMKTVEVCINLLKPEMLALFKMLTILPYNTKISTKVLSRLWNKSIIEVESITKQLRSKSLIMEFYDRDQKNYTYEIHDLIMSYLISSSNDDEVRNMHLNFLRNYDYDVSNGVPVEIADDGYIAFHIGYHLAKTRNAGNMWDLFNKLYLDLRFLGNKVRLTGSADVILDLETYEKYITKNCELDTRLLYSIKEFLIRHGTDLYRYPCTDIVQSILQNESKGILYTKASQIAKERCAKNELYFEFLHEQNVEEIKHSTIDVKEKITCVCFFFKYVLIGTATGAIKLFELNTNKLVRSLQLQSSVRAMSPRLSSPAALAALEHSGVLRLWYDLQPESDHDSDVIEEECEESFNNNYLTNKTIQPKLGPFLNCRWANDFLVTHTSEIIIIYSINAEVLQVLDNLSRDVDILCCIPCNFDKNVIFATPRNLEIVNLKTKEKQVFETTDIVLNILTVPGSNRILTLNENEVTEYEFKMSFKHKENRRGKTVVSSNAVKENILFISMAVNNTGTLLFVSTNDNRIICVDLKTNSYIFDLQNRRGNVTCMSVCEVSEPEYLEGSDLLLTGSGQHEDTAKVWYMEAGYVAANTHRNSKARLTTKFDANFVAVSTPNDTSTNSSTTTPKRHHSFANQHEVVKKVVKTTMSLDRHTLKPLNLDGICNGTSSNGMQPLLAIVDDKNNIQIMRGRKLIAEISSYSDQQVTAVRISPCNHYVIYGLSSGIVKKFIVRSKEIKDIMDVNSPVMYMSFVNSNMLIVAGENKCLMAYRLTDNGEWEPLMLMRGNTDLGSQELLNDIQGVKKKPQQLSSIDSESSINSREFYFNSVTSKLCKGSSLVDCYWIQGMGLVTIESNATIKLWDENLELDKVLHGKQTAPIQSKDVRLCCSDYKKNILVICDYSNECFQTFEVRHGQMNLIQEYELKKKIYSCALTDDGNILALGLESGDVVLWSVSNKRLLEVLKHHSSRVQCCCFSPVPYRRGRPGALSPAGTPGDDEPPLVLVTMTADVVWWDVSYIIRRRLNRNLRTGRTILTPLPSPMEFKNEIQSDDNANKNNYFFNDNLLNPTQMWKANWKHKTYKEGSKRKEILACIKLSGMNAKKICHDEKFSCFVTVDNPGLIYIMTLMGSV
ncbi:uncharacterized protein LOC116769470 [Danaus plexippus]|uniref:uncharacterized protein LOC116769470 n=1 Tax=Danaus plexippus TaxID=13037 RepID=UPI002AB28F41|nr:uncharacterized protein LOC116769470 [Danaus plexippus]XP_061378539.1 uncharacterized protein LOC116769470 [Danaus plexippus]